MTSLIRTEWLKMRKYNAFWWIIGITALSYPGINYMFYMIYENITSNSSQAGQLAKMAIGNPFTFPEAWHTVAYFSSCFVFIPAVVVIMLICNEYSFKTHRQNIIDGWSRGQFITSKLMDVALITSLITLIYTIIAFVTGIVNQERLIMHTWEQAHYIALFGLQTFSQLSIAFLVGFLVRKAFLALGIFLFYFIILENIIVGVMNHYNIPGYKYFPFEISDRMIPRPAFAAKLDLEGYNKSLDAIPQHIILTVIFTVVIWVICYRINSRRDLK
jgi:ABC-2 type transport system permease protein